MYGVNFIGPVETVNGLGISARGYVESILRAKIPANVVNWTFGFEHVYRLPKKYPSGKIFPINIIHLNLDLLTGINNFDNKFLKKFKSDKSFNIAIIYWELMSIYPEWHQSIHQFDEIWCASSFMVRAISAVSSRPVKLIRPSINFEHKRINTPKLPLKIPKDRYIFFYSFDANSVSGRKNPIAFLESYINEFSLNDGACCIIKLMYPDPESQDIKRLKIIGEKREDVIFLEEILSDEQMVEFFQLIDCYVSPHRSEGLGLSIIEAMAAEKPVIATPFGGPCDFVTDKVAYPIKYHLTEVGEGNNPYPSRYIWAEPEIQSIKHLMRHVFSHQDEARNLGKEARKHVFRLFSLDQSSTIIKKELEEIACMFLKNQ